MIDPIDMLKKVADRPGDLREHVVFVGGATVALMLTDLAAHEPRATEDVDAITEIITRPELARFEEKLRKLGFKNDRRGPACRWLLEDLVVDLMPINGELLNLRNQWFAAATEHAETVRLGTLEVRVASPPYLLATKLEAFKDRGAGDPTSSHDLEVVVSLID